MKDNTEGVTGSVLLCLCTLCAPCGLFLAAGLYWLSQPTVLSNPGLTALTLRPKPAISSVLSPDDQERIEKAALEEAKEANDEELVAALAGREPRGTFAQTEPTGKRTW
jgi:hypothetical protein